MSEEFTIVGKFFHSDAKRGWQGVVKARLSENAYQVQLFDWILGQKSHLKVVTADDMADSEWNFYHSAEQMTAWYEQEVKHAWAAELAEDKA